MRYPLALLLAICSTGLADAAEKQWNRAWYGSPVAAIQGSDALSPDHPPIPKFDNTTIRTVVHLAVGGTRIRLHLSNEYGKSPLTIGSIQVVVGGTDRQVTFDGLSQVTVAAGMVAVSDPVNLIIPDEADLEILTFYPRPIPQDVTLVTNGAEPHARITSAPHSNQERSSKWPTYFLTAIDVERESTWGLIVAIGDSITAGGSTSWPALLAARLLESGKHYDVVNAGIGGSRLLRNSPAERRWGQSILNRFQRDVLEQPQAKYVILYAGINDLGLAQTTWDDSSVPTSADIIDAICHLSERAHQRGLRLYAATLAPFENALLPLYYTYEKDNLRRKINTWIRGADCIDGYFDFERVLADPNRASRLNPEFDRGDHLHPNQEGQRALSNAIDLSSFE